MNMRCEVGKDSTATVTRMEIKIKKVSASEVLATQARWPELEPRNPVKTEGQNRLYQVVL